MKKHAKNVRGRIQYRKRCQVIRTEVEILGNYIHQQGNGCSLKQAKYIALFKIKKRNQEIHQLTYGKRKQKTGTSITTNQLSVSSKGTSIATNPSTVTTAGSVSTNETG